VFVNELRSTGRYPIAVVADPGAHAADVLWASSYRPPPGLPEGVLMVLDARTGAEVREVPLAANPLAAGTDPGRGGLIVLNRPARDGYYKARAGEASSLTRLPASLDAPPGIVPLHHAPAGIVVDPLTHRAFVIAAGLAGAPDSPATGLVDVVDTGSGTLLRSVPVGIAPSGIALDAAAGKVYVINAGSGDRVPPSISILSALDGTPLAVAGFRALRPIGSPAIYALAPHPFPGSFAVDAAGGQLYRSPADPRHLRIVETSPALLAPAGERVRPVLRPHAVADTLRPPAYPDAPSCHTTPHSLFYYSVCDTYGPVGDRRRGLRVDRQAALATE